MKNVIVGVFYPYILYNFLKHSFSLHLQSGVKVELRKYKLVILMN